MTDIISSVEESVDHAIAAVGHNIVLGAPLGLGKPVQVMNAFFQRALKDPEINLHIYTALSLELPTPGSHIEANLAGPILQRLFGDYEELDYMKAMRAGPLPANIQVSELYVKAGSMKGVAAAQQNYISSNYTHIARDLCDRGINVLVQMVAVRDTEEGVRISLSGNPDTGLDVAARLIEERPESFFSIAQAHSEMPYMENDAEIDDDFFDLLVRNPAYDKRLFAVPNAAVPLADYATAMHASSLIVDGGTLQIGIGSLGDAVAHACIVRHKHSEQYRKVLSALSQQESPLAADGQPFAEGLYVSTEMFVNGMMHLMEKGVVKRRVYDQLDLQLGINRGDITASVDEDLYDYARQCNLLPKVLDQASLQELQFWGILSANTTIDADTLRVDGAAVVNDTDNIDTRTILLKAVEGTTLRHGRVLHGGFFLGPQDFYAKLRDLGAQGQEDICMTSVLRTNQLLLDYKLYCAQRKNARFINTGMMVTLAGAVVSDALENGEIISGVG
ncbi:MAG: acetyl-CoA hydrolase/transferase C-terminal domain-containing protein, partial [Halieaceae bacterium]